MNEIDPVASRHWATKDEDSPMTCYLGMRGRVTIGDIVAHFTENYPHVDPMTVQLNYSTAVWNEPPTAEDQAKREAHRVWQEQRQNSWERETYTRLKEKFDGKGTEHQ